MEPTFGCWPGLPVAAGFRASSCHPCHSCSSSFAVDTGPGRTQDAFAATYAPDACGPGSRVVVNKGTNYHIKEATSYLVVLHVLVHNKRALALLAVEHVPEQREPVKQKAIVACRGVGNGCWGQVFGTLLVEVVLGVGIHGIVAQAIQVLTRAPRLVRLDLRVGLQHCAGTVVHALTEEVIVDVCLEQRTATIDRSSPELHLLWLLLLLLLLLGLWGLLGTSGHCAIIHHGHRGAANGTAHGVHLSHVTYIVHVHG